MAEAPAYTTVPGKIPDLFRKIRETGVPGKVNHDWLKTVGLTSSNDRSLIPVLKQIEFVDGHGAPTPAWKQYRGAEAKSVLGRAIKVGYGDLFQTYPDANQRSNTDIAHVFRTKSDAGKQTIDKMVATFKNLVSLAEFPSQPERVGEPEVPDSPISVEESTNGITVAATNSRSNGLTVNINVALTLPETTDEKVFASFFKAMREHLLTDLSS